MTRRLHRYNAREEQMRADMLLRRSWGRYRRRTKPKMALHWTRYFHGWPDAKVLNPEPGVYVWEWTNDPAEKGGGVVDTAASPS